MSRSDRAGVEGRVDDMIDALHDDTDLTVPTDDEVAELRAVAILLQKLVPDKAAGDYPKEDFNRRLLSKVMSAASHEQVGHEQVRLRPRRKPNLRMLLGIAAAVVLVSALTFGQVLWKKDTVYAMSLAVGKITSYHGTLEKSYTTSAGDRQVIRSFEVWSADGKYLTKMDDGTITANNGEVKWQIRNEDQSESLLRESGQHILHVPGEHIANTNSLIVALLPLAPDPDAALLDLRNLARQAMDYPHKATGEDVVAGRKATCIEVSPPGGLPYWLWTDCETDLPLRLRTAMQNGIQTTYTYTEFEANAPMDDELFAFRVPEGAKVVELNPGQLVMTPGEAGEIAGFAPVIPSNQDWAAPMRFLAYPNEIRVLLNRPYAGFHAEPDGSLAYVGVVIIEKPIEGPLNPAPYASLGMAGESRLEVLADQLRWHQNGLELTVVGPDRVEAARALVADLVLPSEMPDADFAPSVNVPVDLAIAERDQQQVDGGHSPWQVDPLSVALTFVNLKASPEGITGEFQVPEELFVVERNSGTRAVVAVAGGDIARVYLERLVRQDHTGIWSVVGYDLR